MLQGDAASEYRPHRDAGCSHRRKRCCRLQQQQQKQQQFRHRVQLRPVSCTDHPPSNAVHLKPVRRSGQERTGAKFFSTPRNSIPSHGSPREFGSTSRRTLDACSRVHAYFGTKVAGIMHLSQVSVLHTMMVDPCSTDTGGALRAARPQQHTRRRGGR